MIFNDDVFDVFPLMQTARLKLREINVGDINEVFTIFSNSEVVKYFGRLPMEKTEEAVERIEKTSAAFKNKEGIRWGITLIPENKLIGSAGIWRIDKTHFRAEIGYDLLPEYWRMGIMFEALTNIIKFGFEEINLHTIEANTDPENIPSIKLLEKLGFKQEGYLKESFLFEGKFLDTSLFSLIR